MLKNQNYLLQKVDLRFFSSYGLRTAIKISTFYVIDNFQAIIVTNGAKRYRLFKGALMQI